MNQRTKFIKIKRIVLSEYMCAKLSEHLETAQHTAKDADAILTIGTLLHLIDTMPLEMVAVPRGVDHEA